MRLRFFGVSLAALVLLAGPLHAQKDTARKIRRDPLRITAEEIVTVPEVTDVYQLIQRLRPRFLRTRGPVHASGAAPPTPIVYLDGIRRGDPEFLRTISVNTIQEIRYLSGRDASIRYGLGHEAGAILVSTFKNPRR